MGAEITIFCAVIAEKNASRVTELLLSNAENTLQSEEKKRHSLKKQFKPCGVRLVDSKHMICGYSATKSACWDIPDPYEYSAILPKKKGKTYGKT
jgi:hypothetical protein